MVFIKNEEYLTMKKIILSSIILCSAVISHADIDVTGPDVTVSGSGNGNVLFSTDGGKLTATAHTGISSITVDSGVSGTISTNSAIAYYMGTAEDGAIISGAGADNSELTFDGYILGGNLMGSQEERYTMSVKDITLNLLGKNASENNLLRASNMTFTNSNLNILAGAHSTELQSVVTSGNPVALVNSKLTVDGGASLVVNISGGNNVMRIDKDSSLIVNGILNTQKTNYYTVSGTLEIGASGTFKTASSYIEVFNGGNIIISGNANIGSKIRMSTGGRLTLNSSNIDGVNGYITSSGYGNSINVYGNSSIYINAANQLAFSVSSSDTVTKTLTVNLGDLGDNDYLLYLTYLVKFPSGGGSNYYAENDMLSGAGFYYDFINFTDGAVVLDKNNISEEVLQKSLSHMLVNGESGMVDYIVKNIDGVDYYALVAVPEPAEWAAIFGAIALLIALRRRK